MKRSRPTIRILHLITQSARRSGPEQLLLTLINKMDRRYFINKVFMLRDTKFNGKSLLEEEELPSDSIQLLPWNKRRLFLDYNRQMRRIIHEEDIHILHCHDNRATLLGLLIGKRMRLPLVRSLHGTLEHTLKLKLAFYIDVTLLRFFDSVIIGSDAIRCKIPGGSPERIIKIPNAIDIEKTLKQYDIQDIRNKFNLEVGDRVICTVGRLHPEKGHIYLLKAAKEICEEFPESRFLIVGDGPLKAELKKSAYNLGLNGFVNFTGYYSDIREVLAISDIFVQPSLEESLPLTILEAMSYGKPIVATNVGGMSEAVKDGVNGLLVQPKDSRKLFESIATLLKNPSKMKTMGESGLMIVRDKFSAESYINQYQTVYEFLVSETS